MKADIKQYLLCKISIMSFDWQYVMHVTNFKAFYILLNNLNDTPRVFFHFKTDCFVLNRNKDNSFV